MARLPVHLGRGARDHVDLLAGHRRRFRLDRALRHPQPAFRPARLCPDSAGSHSHEQRARAPWWLARLAHRSRRRDRRAATRWRTPRRLRRLAGRAHRGDVLDEDQYRRLSPARDVVLLAIARSDQRACRMAIYRAHPAACAARRGPDVGFVPTRRRAAVLALVRAGRRLTGLHYPPTLERRGSARPPGPGRNGLWLHDRGRLGRDRGGRHKSA